MTWVGSACPTHSYYDKLDKGSDVITNPYYICCRGLYSGISDILLLTFGPDGGKF